MTSYSTLIATEIWQRPLINWKQATDPSSARNALSCGVKIVKIGPVHPEILPIDVAISHTVSECQSDENGEFAIFRIKSVAMATSLEISKKEVQIDHLWPKSFHSM